MSEVIIYEDGKVALEIPVEHETIWLNAHQIADIFGVNRPAIVKHIGNIYKTGELDRQATCSILEQVAADGKTRKMNLYSLDMIISVGYRVNSKKATKFRIWATDVLRRYLLNGYALDKERLQQQKLDELFATLQLIRSSIDAATLRESRGFVEIISNYAKSWALLQGYDEQSLEEVAVTMEQKFILDYDEAKAAIGALKDALIARGEATELFGNEKAGEFKGNLLNIYQSFAGEELLPSIEQKAANLLYYVIKGHPFTDGNKRIGAYLFVLFLSKNWALYKADGELKINDNALASLALLVAVSAPEQKAIIIKLIMNILYDGSGI